MSGSSPTATASELEADRAAAELHNDRFEDALVHLVEAVLINFQHGERLVGHLGGDAALVLDLGVIADAAQEVVGDARRARGCAGRSRRAPCSSMSTFSSRAERNDDLLELVGLVVIEPLANREAGEQTAR